MHRRRPKPLQVIGDAIHRVIVETEICRDLVGHFYELLNFLHQMISIQQGLFNIFGAVHAGIQTRAFSSNSSCRVANARYSFCHSEGSLT